MASGTLSTTTADPPLHARSAVWVTALVCAVWLLIGVVLGSQTALGTTMQGNPMPLSGALRSSLISWLPWIPATLVAVWLARRWPLARGTWHRRIWIHLAAAPALGWVANVGVVLGFWISSGNYGTVTGLAGQAAFWATIRGHVAFTVYFATLVVTQVFLYLRAARDRELRVARLETELAQARFRALNEQIRPHFLFNTLHTIGQLWRSGRHEEADAMLDHLGALFQKVRASTDRPGIALDEEIAMVQEYLAIERTRFSDRLGVGVSATEAARVCCVPPLVLQPIVENAVRHGISGSPEAGRIEVDARVEGDRLVVEIFDDGPGFDPDAPVRGTGTGLSNTRQRLAHAFGDRASLRIERVRPAGTRVRIELPRLADAEDLWEGARA